MTDNEPPKSTDHEGAAEAIKGADSSAPRQSSRSSDDPHTGEEFYSPEFDSQEEAPEGTYVPPEFAEEELEALGSLDLPRRSRSALRRTNRPSSVPRAPSATDLERHRYLIVDETQVELAARAIVEKLDEANLQGFSLPAARNLIDTQTRYFQDLGEAAIALARADDMDSVSADHVKRAKRRLRKTGSSLRQSVLNIAGGAILGAALQETVGIANSSGPLDKIRVLLTIGLWLGGTISLVFALMSRSVD